MRAVLVTGNVTTIVGPGSGTVLNIVRSTDRFGFADEPNARTNAVWSITFNWLTSAFSVCIASTESVTVSANILTIVNNTCHL